MTGRTERTAGRSLGIVGIALLVSAALGYPVLIVVGRLLSPADNAIFLAFWGIVFGIGSSLSPVEQEVSRLSAHANLRDGRVGPTALRTIAVAAVTVGVLGAVLALPPVAERMYGAEYVSLGVIALAAAVAFALQFGTRGVLIGFGQVKPYGGLLVAEAAVRILLIGVFLVMGAANLMPISISVALGSFVFLPFLFTARKHVDFVGAAEPWGVVARRTLLLMLSAGLTATVLTGYPAVAKFFAAKDDLNALGSLFLALSLARVPLLLLSPVQAMAVPTVVRLLQEEDGHRRLVALLTKGTLAAFGLAGIGGLVGWLIGPWAVQLLFGEKHVVESWAVAGLVWSSVLLGAVLLLAAVLVAREQPGRVLLTWAAVASLSVLVLAFAPGDMVLRSVLGLVIAPTVGVFAALGLVLRAGSRDASVTG
jgi:O-antigen/teichoic acid export membrane protein